MINQSKLEYIITQIQSKKVLVVGDIMLDKYVFGHVDRISPEAPIPIISVKNTRLLEGGAGNVIKNLNSLNIKTAFISLIGNDASGKTLKDDNKCRGYDDDKKGCEKQTNTCIYIPNFDRKSLNQKLIYFCEKLHHLK